MRAVDGLLVVFLLAGCEYGPLELQENEPVVADAMVDEEITVTGTNILRYHPSSNADALCTNTQEVRGFAAPELNDAKCIGCTRVYRLALLETEDNDCEYGRASVDIAFAPLEFVTQASTSTNFANWLEEGGATELVYNDFANGGDPGWFARMGAFDGETPWGPVAGGGPWDCGADTCIQQYFWSSEGSLLAAWWLALDFDE